MRIGLVTTIDRRSAIARHSLQLAQLLGSHHDVVVFAEPTNAPMHVPMALRPVADLARTHVDQRIVVLGNSGHHRHGFHIAREGGAIVICHDVLLAHLVMQMLPPDDIERSVRAWYGNHAASEFMATAYSERPLRDGPRAMEVPLFEPVLQRADGIIVHSEWARSIIAPRVAAPVGVIPLASLVEPSPATRVASGDARVVLALGDANSTQCTELLLDAVARLGRPDVRCVLAGDITAERAAKLRAHAVRLGIESQTQIHRGPSREDERRLRSTAALCVELRRPTTAGGSLALLEQMAEGVTVVVADDGWTAELPDDVVVKVPVDVDAADLASTLARWLDDDAARAARGQHAAAHVVRHHALADRLTEIESFIDEVDAARPFIRTVRTMASTSGGWSLPTDSALPARWVTALGSMLGSLPPAARPWPDDDGRDDRDVGVDAGASAPQVQPPGV